MKKPVVLVAPNAFKHGPDAFEVAEAIKRGLAKSRLNPTVILMPIADGGDGTLPIICKALDAQTISLEVQDPLGRSINAGFGFAASSATAIIELADASGLRLLKKEERNPLKANTYGTGQLIKAAIGKGARTIFLSVGGSATVDGGMGILAALGFQFLNAAGSTLQPSGENLHHIVRVKKGKISSEVAIVVLTDVKNPLTGSRGAARVFGPQKGAEESDVERLEKGLEKWTGLIKEEMARDIGLVEGGGAAGGVAAGLWGWLGAEIKPGAEYILDLLGAGQQIEKADYIITAEGSLDGQTAEGKAPFALLQLAKKWNKPVFGLAGRIPGEIPRNALGEFDALFAIGSEPERLEAAISHTTLNLERTAYNIGNLLFLREKSQA